MKLFYFEKCLGCMCYGRDELRENFRKREKREQMRKCNVFLNESLVDFLYFKILGSSQILIKMSFANGHPLLL